jgi:hypothetical protein
MASAFADQQRWARRLSKAHQKRGDHRVPSEPAPTNCTGGRVFEMDAEELVRRAREFYPGLEATPDNIKYWVAAGLLPAPRVTQGGRGKGKGSDYPDGSPEELAAAGFARFHGYSKPTVAQARKVVLHGSIADTPEQLELHQALLHKKPLNDTSKAARNLKGAMEIFASALARARSGLPVDAEVAQLSFTNFALLDRRFVYYVCLPGEGYWDPRADSRERKDGMEVYTSYINPDTGELAD